MSLETLVKYETPEDIQYTQANGAMITVRKTTDGTLDVHVVVPPGAQIPGFDLAQSWETIHDDLAERFTIVDG